VDREGIYGRLRKMDREGTLEGFDKFVQFVRESGKQEAQRELAEELAALRASDAGHLSMIQALRTRIQLLNEEIELNVKTMREMQVKLGKQEDELQRLRLNANPFEMFNGIFDDYPDNR
jgi:hypothetical protein